MKTNKTFCMLVGILGILVLSVISLAANITTQGTPNNVAPTISAITMTPQSDISPATTFYVAADVNDANGQTDIQAINMSCYGGAGVEWTDSWDSVKLLNTSYITWTSLNTTAYRVNGTFNTSINYWSLKSINSTWICKVYVNDTSGLSVVTTNATALTVNKATGITLAQSTCVFDADNPGTNDKQWACGGNRNNTITHNGNVGINVTILGADLTGQTDATWKIGVGNITWNSTYDVANGGVLPGNVLTTSAAQMIGTWSRGASSTSNTTNVTAWIDFPLPLKSQLYQGTITISSNEDPS